MIIKFKHIYKYIYKLIKVNRINKFNKINKINKSKTIKKNKTISNVSHISKHISLLFIVIFLNISLFFSTILFILEPNTYATELNSEDNTSDIMNSINKTSSDVDIDRFIKEADKYSKNTLNINTEDILKDAIKGKVDNKNIVSSILDVLFKELKVTLKSFGIILIIVLLNSVIKSISDNLENTSVSEIIYIVQYILLLTVIIKDFSSVLEITNNTIYNLIGFCNSLFPILTTLIVLSGKVISFVTIEPVMLFLITMIANIIGDIIIPLVMIQTVFSISGNISDMVQLNKISKFIKSCVIWSLGILLTIFVAVISVEGTLSSNVDVVATKTTKAAVSNLVPIVGKVLGDAVDTVLGATNLLKNAVRNCRS